MSSTTTSSPRNAAVPQEPAEGPIGSPSMAWVKAGGRLGDAPWRRCRPSGSSSRIDVNMSRERASITRSSAASVVASGAPRAISSSTWFWPWTSAAKSRAEASARLRAVISWRKIDSPSLDG